MIHLVAPFIIVLLDAKPSPTVDEVSGELLWEGSEGTFAGGILHVG